MASTCQFSWFLSFTWCSSNYESELTDYLRTKTSFVYCLNALLYDHWFFFFLGYIVMESEHVKQYASYCLTMAKEQLVFIAWIVMLLTQWEMGCHQSVYIWIIARRVHYIKARRKRLRLFARSRNVENMVKLEATN